MTQESIGCNPKHGLGTLGTWGLWVPLLATMFKKRNLFAFRGFERFLAQSPFAIDCASGIVWAAL